jgi:cytochrome c peroxidase
MKGDKSLLNESEVHGMKLFYGTRTNCSGCHSGFNFTNYSFVNNGLYTVFEDEGRMRLTKEESDRALFKVPTLRNVEVTGPYMHDGSMNTLEEVVEHYSSGVKMHPNKSKMLTPLSLSSDEQKQLVDFLKTLTDHQFLTNQNFKNN